MLEVFSEAIRPINLPFTILLGIVVLYWILVAVGAFGLDFGADGDIDADVGADAAHSDVGWFSHFLNFINVGEVPITIVLSFLTLSAWFLSIVVNYYWTGGSMVLGLVALLPIFIVSAIVTRYLTLPFRPLIRVMSREPEAQQPIVGRTCLITTSEVTRQFGQAQIDTKGAPILINVRTLEDQPLPRGSTGLVVRKDDAKDLFYVVPISSDKLE